MQTDKIKQFFVRYQIFLKILAVIVAAIPFAICFIYESVYCDSAYYLAISERVSEGFLLYRDVHCGYAPLWFYLAAGVRMLFCIPLGCYWPYLLVYDLFYLAAGIILYKLIKNFTENKSIAFFCAWLFFPLSFWQYGYAVFLEIPSVFFGLLSSWLIIRLGGKTYWHYLWIGAIASMAFLTKQYGAGFLILDIYLILFFGNSSWKSIAIFLVGYLLPILACILIWQQDILMLFSNGYGTTTAVSAGRDVSLLSKLGDIVNNGLRFCGDACPAALVGLLIVWNSKQQNRLRYFMFALCGILGFALQFYFSSARHYRIFMIPFACLLMAEMLVTQTPLWLSWIKYLAILWTVGASLYNAYHIVDFRLDDYTPDDRKTISCNIRQYVPESDILWPTQGSYFDVVFTTCTRVPNLSTVAYSFGPLGLDEEKAMEQLKAAQWVVHNPMEIDESAHYLTDSVLHYIEQFPSILISSRKGVRLYRMEKGATIVPLAPR